MEEEVKEGRGETKKVKSSRWSSCLGLGWWQWRWRETAMCPDVFWRNGGNKFALRLDGKWERGVQGDWKGFGPFHRGRKTGCHGLPSFRARWAQMPAGDPGADVQEAAVSDTSGLRGRARAWTVLRLDQCGQSPEPWVLPGPAMSRGTEGKIHPFLKSLLGLLPGKVKIPGALRMAISPLTMTLVRQEAQGHFNHHYEITAAQIEYPGTLGNFSLFGVNKNHLVCLVGIQVSQPCSRGGQAARQARWFWFCGYSPQEP